jgi:hypothetical protein
MLYALIILALPRKSSNMNPEQPVPSQESAAPQNTTQPIPSESFGSPLPVEPVSSTMSGAFSVGETSGGSFSPTTPADTGKPYVGTWLLTLLLPGIDLIYLGYIGRGIVKFITGGGLGIWTIISLVRLFKGKTISKGGEPLIGREKYLKLSLIITIIVVVLQIGMITTLYATGFYANYFKSTKSSLNKSEAALTTTISNSTSGSTVAANARTVQQIAESFNANSTSQNSQYPTKISDFSSITYAPLPSGITVSGTNPTAANGKTTIGYQYDNFTSTGSGGRITFWDYSTNALTTNPLYVGDATAQSIFIVPGA